MTFQELLVAPVRSSVVTSGTLEDAPKAVAGPAPARPRRSRCPAAPQGEAAARSGRRTAAAAAPSSIGAVSEAEQLVVGFDLDMTLIDTVPGSATLVALGDELGVEFPVEELTTKLGPPLEILLAPYLPADRSLRPPTLPRALPGPRHRDVPAFPGAHEALAAVRNHGGRVVVVTGKYAPNAQLHVDHLGFDVDHLEGWVWGVGKADVLKREGAEHLRRRPRPRRGGRAGGRRAQRVGADRRLHARGARGRPAPT